MLYGAGALKGLQTLALDTATQISSATLAIILPISVHCSLFKHRRVYGSLVDCVYFSCSIVLFELLPFLYQSALFRS